MTSQEEPTITAISPTSTLGTAAASEHQPEIASPTDREIPPLTNFKFPPSPPLPGTADSIPSRVVPKKIFDVSNDDDEVVSNNDLTVESVVPPQDGNLESPDNLDSETYLAETVAKVLGNQTKEQQQLQTEVSESSVKKVLLSSTSNSSPDSTHINNSNINNFNINNNNNNSINNINNSINNISSSASSQQSIQPPPPPITGKNCLSDSISPSTPPNPSNHLNMSQPDSPLTVPISTNDTNDTVTTTTTQPQVTTAPSFKLTKFTISGDSPDTTPTSSPVQRLSDIHCTVGDGSGALPNFSHDFELIPPTLDDSYSSEPLDYCLPPSNNSMSRAQRKLLLQRDSFLADDENYVIHPHNQRRLTKAIERINREHTAISLYRDPMIESLQRAFAKYAQDHPEVLDDDFGANYEDSKEWGILSDQTKSMDQIGSIYGPIS